MRKTVACCTLVIVAACSSPSPDSKPSTISITSVPRSDIASRDSAAREAPENYLRVINSNNADSLMSMMTEDVVFLAADAKPVIGKPAVRAWVDDYVKAFHSHWEKPQKEFVVAGDYAMERYDYTSTDTPVAGGKPVVDTGWGLVIFHREPDGVWRVARDAFGPDHPPAK